MQSTFTCSAYPFRGRRFIRTASCRPAMSAAALHAEAAAEQGKEQEEFRTVHTLRIGKAWGMPPGKVRGSAPIMIFGNPTSNGRASSSRSIWSSVRVMDSAAMLPSRYCVLEPPRRGMQRRYFWRAQARATVTHQLLTEPVPAPNLAGYCMILII